MRSHHDSKCDFVGVIATCTESSSSLSSICMASPWSSPSAVLTPLQIRLQWITFLFCMRATPPSVSLCAGVSIHPNVLLSWQQHVNFVVHASLTTRMRKPMFSNCLRSPMLGELSRPELLLFFSVGPNPPFPHSTIQSLYARFTPFSASQVAGDLGKCACFGLELSESLFAIDWF